MAAILSRSPQSAIPSPDTSSPQPQKKPSRRSSFLSLRCEKQAVDASISASSRDHDRTMTPSSFRTPDVARRPTTSSSTDLKPRTHSRKSSKSISSVYDHSPSHSGRSTEHRSRERRHRSEHDQESHIFPSVEYDQYASGSSQRTAPSRTHSSADPFARLDQYDATIRARQFNISLLDSASSVLSQFEDSPQTPVDELSFLREPIFSMPVVVAAPVAGVETMDALVDGMNHRYDHDDHFMGSGGISGRSKVSKSGHHPLYHPPLPTPPPGVVLGKSSSRRPPSRRHDSDADDDETPEHFVWSEQQRRRRPGSSRNVSISTISSPTPRSRPGSSQSNETYAGSMYSSFTHPSKSVAPSISEIIRAHAPASQQVRSRKSSYAHSVAPVTLLEQLEASSEDVATADEVDLISRSSVDTIAEEVQQTIRNQNRSCVSPGPLRTARSFQRNSTVISMTRTLSSPRSEGRPESSLFSYSTVSDHFAFPALDLSGLTKVPTNSPSQAIAQYLRSARLTTLVTLTRGPHASGDRPLTVSLSDLGSPHGLPVVVFLGLGCVRHIMGLYDEMAECLGIRLITIDRWGLGRTDTPRTKMTAGIPEWASVVEEVLDQLHVDQCSVMAHSAGAPYALAFANRFPERIRGDVCLLAPWVGGGEGAGYKWLKYVPNGLLKTAQAAEWKVQAWMIGKPPTFAFEGIGYDATPSASPSQPAQSESHPSPTRMPSSSKASYTSPVPEEGPRPSMSSGIFSEYDDLRDFEGRFESRSTLERRSSESDHGRSPVMNRLAITRKSSKGLLGRLKGGHSSRQPESPKDQKMNGSRTGKGLKVLRSMGSLKGRSKPPPNLGPSSELPEVPWLPSPISPDVGLGLGVVDWSDMGARGKSTSTPPVATTKTSRSSHEPPTSESTFSARANGRRSISLTTAAERLKPSSPPPLPSPVPEASSTPASFQVALGNALLAASHAESAKGTHRDLLQILNHDRQPWGFSYSAYPHTVRVWYGDKDERIAENAVRWMENTMGPDKCLVNVVQGADHALMYKSSVVIDVLEKIADFWQHE